MICPHHYEELKAPGERQTNHVLRCTKATQGKHLMITKACWELQKCLEPQRGTEDIVRSLRNTQDF